MRYIGEDIFLVNLCLGGEKVREGKKIEFVRVDLELSFSAFENERQTVI